jgi:hypothetical protein
MFTLARKAITSLVVSFGLSARFDVKKGEAQSSVRRTAPTGFPPRFGSTSSRHRGGGVAGRAVCGRWRAGVRRDLDRCSVLRASR